MTETCATLQERGGWWEDLVANRCWFPIGPINTYSNIAYLIAGVWAFVTKPSWASAVFGLSMAFLAVGSALYHGTKRVWASRLDNAGMYAVFAALLTYTISPTHPYIAPLMALGAIILVKTIAYTENWKYMLNPMMGLMVWLSVITVGIKGHLGEAAMGLTLFGIAYAIWWADKNKTFWFKRWGHGLWHVLTALAVFTLFYGASK